MTCVWDSLIAAVRTLRLDPEFHNIRHARDFVVRLQSRNGHTINTKVNGHFLRPQELIENYEAVQRYKPESVHDGYLCSSSDPFLALFSEVYNVDVIHTLNGFDTVYNQSSPTGEVNLRSSSTHMRFISARNFSC